MPMSAAVRAPGAAGPAILTTGLAGLATRLFRGQDVSAMHAALRARIERDPADAAALMELSLLLQLCGRPEQGLVLQARALSVQSCYHLPPADARTAHVRLLMFAVAGDFMSNTPVEFLIDGMPVSLYTLYVDSGRLPAAEIPPHDIALVGVAESAENLPVLLRLAPLLETWPKPVLNRPARILDLARERLFEVLAGIPGLEIPRTVRTNRPTLEALAAREIALSGLLGNATYPIIVRPAGSHAGNGLEKIDDVGLLATYLAMHPADHFYVSPFVDYASADGMFRKYRVVSISGRPYLAHMALARHWMLHYLNAGMMDDEAKRVEEACAMSEFAHGFGARHGLALRRMAATLDLDYFAIDCAETRDGNLLVFEAGTAMIVHRMDPPEVFAYKQAPMGGICDAFVEMLAHRICDSAIRTNLG